MVIASFVFLDTYHGNTVVLYHGITIEYHVNTLVYEYGNHSVSWYTSKYHSGTILYPLCFMIFL